MVVLKSKIGVGPIPIKNVRDIGFDLYNILCVAERYSTINCVLLHMYLLYLIVYPSI